MQIHKIDQYNLQLTWTSCRLEFPAWIVIGDNIGIRGGLSFTSFKNTVIKYGMLPACPLTSLATI